MIVGIFVLLTVLNISCYNTYGKLKKLSSSESCGKDEKDIIVADMLAVIVFPFMPVFTVSNSG